MAERIFLLNIIRREISTFEEGETNVNVSFPGVTIDRDLASAIFAKYLDFL